MPTSRNCTARSRLPSTPPPTNSTSVASPDGVADRLASMPPDLGSTWGSVATLPAGLASILLEYGQPLNAVAYAGDAKPGDTNGQGVGNVWFALTANGELVK